MGGSRSAAWVGFRDGTGSARVKKEGSVKAARRRMEGWMELKRRWRRDGWA